MNTSFLLSLPRLHANLFPLPQNCHTLWPGLPDKPQHAWSPDLPWSPSLSSACLADFEQSCKDGASGSPVQALCTEQPPADLSPAELRALQEFKGEHTEQSALPLRQKAQQILLLAWLREQQAIDMAALESRIQTYRKKLTEHISGRIHISEASPVISENELPDGKKILAAALAFLPDMPSPLTLFISSSSFLKDIETADTVQQDPSVPYRTVILSAGMLAEYCGKDATRELKRELSPQDWNRTLTLWLPKGC